MLQKSSHVENDVMHEKKYNRAWFANQEHCETMPPKEEACYPSSSSVYRKPEVEGLKVNSNKHSSIYPSLIYNRESFVKSWKPHNEQIDKKLQKQNDEHMSKFCIENPVLAKGTDSLDDLSYSEMNAKKMVDLDSESDSEMKANKLETPKRHQSLMIETKCTDKPSHIFANNMTPTSIRKESSETKHKGLNDLYHGIGSNKFQPSASASRPTEKEQREKVPTPKPNGCNTSWFVTSAQDSLPAVQTNSDCAVQDSFYGNQGNINVTLPSAPPSEDVSEASASVSLNSWSSHHAGLAPVHETHEKPAFPQGFLLTPDAHKNQQPTLSPLAQPVYTNQMSQNIRHTQYPVESRQQYPELPLSIIRLIQGQQQTRNDHQQQHGEKFSRLHGPPSAQHPIPSTHENLQNEQQRHLLVGSHHPLPAYYYSPEQETKQLTSTYGKSQLPFFDNSAALGQNQVSTLRSENLNAFQENICVKNAHPFNIQIKDQTISVERNQPPVPPTSCMDIKDPSTHLSCSKQDSRSSDTLADLSSWHASLGQAPSSSTAVQMPMQQHLPATPVASNTLKHMQPESPGCHQDISSEKFQRAEQVPPLPVRSTSKHGGLQNHDDSLAQMVRAQLDSIYNNISSVQQSHQQASSRRYTDMPLSGSSTLASGSTLATHGLSHAYVEQLILEAVSRAAQEAYQHGRKIDEQKSTVLKENTCTTTSKTQAPNEIQQVSPTPDIPLIMSQWVTTVASMLPSLAEVEGYIDYTIDQLGHALYAEIESIVLGGSTPPSIVDTQQKGNAALSSCRASKMSPPVSPVKKNPQPSDLNIQIPINPHSSIQPYAPNSFLSPQPTAQMSSDSHHNLSAINPKSSVSPSSTEQAHLDFTKKSVPNLTASEHLWQPADQKSFVNVSKLYQALPKFDQYSFTARKISQENTAQNSQGHATHMFHNHTSSINMMTNKGIQNAPDSDRSDFITCTNPETPSSHPCSINRSCGLSEETRAKLANLSQQYEQTSEGMLATHTVPGESMITVPGNEYRGSIAKSPLRVDSQTNTNQILVPLRQNIDILAQNLSTTTVSGSNSSVETHHKTSSSVYSPNTESAPASIFCSTDDQKKKICNGARSSHHKAPGVSRSQGYVGGRVYPRLNTNSFHALSPKGARRFRKVSGRANRSEEDGGTPSELLSSFIEEDVEDSTDGDSYLAEQAYATFKNSSTTAAVSQASDTSGLSEAALERASAAFSGGKQSFEHCRSQSKDLDKTCLIPDSKTSSIKDTSLEGSATGLPPATSIIPVKPKRPAPAIPTVAKQQVGWPRETNGKIVSQSVRSGQSNIPTTSVEMANQKPVPCRPAPPIPVTKKSGLPNQGFVMGMTNLFDQRARSMSISPPRAVHRPAPKAPPQPSGSTLPQRNDTLSTERTQSSRQVAEKVNSLNTSDINKKANKLVHKDSTQFHTSNQNPGTRPFSEAFKGQVDRKSHTPVNPIRVQSPSTKPELFHTKNVTSTGRHSSKENMQASSKGPSNTPAHLINTNQAPSFKMYSSAPLKKPKCSEHRRQEQVHDIHLLAPNRLDKDFSRFPASLEKPFTQSAQPINSNSLTQGNSNSLFKLSRGQSQDKDKFSVTGATTRIVLPSDLSSPTKPATKKGKKRPVLEPAV
ncbi:hypothetical protein ElyMa_004688900 [Elysia marginata]|uniref:Uncharacterized protein n=1 Tax=Elysia marginata TaxID=1093978 RepID=A0AAV4I646_9GAST|nr:hypothetical protein ElyMa_004688900 [Elysia marginata]